MIQNPHNSRFLLYAGILIFAFGIINFLEPIVFFISGGFTFYTALPWSIIIYKPIILAFCQFSVTPGLFFPTIKGGDCAAQWYSYGTIINGFILLILAFWFNKKLKNKQQ